MTHEFNPDWRVAPGETLAEIFDERPVTRGRTVEALGPGVVQALLDGATTIDDHIAITLQTTTGVSATFWLNLEAAYRKPITP